MTPMITVDASVHINALNPAETGSAASKAFLDWLQQERLSIVSPTLLLVEIASAVARGKNDGKLGIEAMRHLRALPRHTWLPLDPAMAMAAATIGASYRLRGADAVYAAAAQHAGSVLVTADRQQLERLRDAVPVMSPPDALSQLPDILAHFAKDVDKAKSDKDNGVKLVEYLAGKRPKDGEREV
ncbi:MAG TPA: PIN domain-containing protein [Anaerolineae bacterium]|nr:PIN domain-containing protein [Anaerolineae bacterium]HNU04669.1 PIN domain-containing protein [Anaerolineae bacterium]